MIWDKFMCYKIITSYPIKDWKYSLSFEIRESWPYSMRPHNQCNGDWWKKLIEHSKAVEPSFVPSLPSSSRRHHREPDQGWPYTTESLTRADPIPQRACPGLTLYNREPDQGWPYTTESLTRAGPIPQRAWPGLTLYNREPDQGWPYTTESLTRLSVTLYRTPQRAWPGLTLYWAGQGAN